MPLPYNKFCYGMFHIPSVPSVISDPSVLKSFEMTDSKYMLAVANRISKFPCLQF